MPKLNWKTKSVAVTVVVLLVVAGNPELRAFLLILDFLGADLVLLLLGGYLHHYWPMVVCHLKPWVARINSSASWVCKSLRWIAYGLHPRDVLWVQLDHIGIAGGTVGRVAIGYMRA
ncbi:MAG: hypothetical protein Q7T69_04800 [Rhodoferax sp.]|nr:hypothetical protein [Rhodoferax sp.]